VGWSWWWEGVGGVGWKWYGVVMVGHGGVVGSGVDWGGVGWSGVKDRWHKAY